MSASALQPALIVGGSGLVGSQAARTLRRLHSDLPIAIGGRNVNRAEKIAQEVGNAEAVAVDLTRPDLAGGAKLEPGLYFPDSLIEPGYALRRLKEFGLQVRRVS